MYKLLFLFLLSILLLSCGLKGKKTSLDISTPVISGSPILVLNS